MLIGLYDQDITTYNHVVFNLELMKLATFYKWKRELVSTSLSFQPEKYSKFIYRKDYNDNIFPQELYKNNTIDYGGLAFTDNKYAALPVDIELLKADTSIYAKYEKRFGTNKTMRDFFRKMTNANHLRLSIDDKHIMNNFQKQISWDRYQRVIFFHDYNIVNIEGSLDAVKDILKATHNNRCSVALKFPIQASEYQTIQNWIELQPSTDVFPIAFYGMMTDEELVDFIHRRKSTGISTQFEYWITSGQTLQSFIQQLPRVFKQLLFLKMNNEKILLKYDNYFFDDEVWETIIGLFNCFLSWNMSRPVSFFEFAQTLVEIKIPYTKIVYTKQDAREAFIKINEINSNLFSDFYTQSKVVLKGGNFVYD